MLGFAFLILLGVGIFVYRELFPEYKIYQQGYVDLEHFRAAYSHGEPPPFSKGVKQILLSNNTGLSESVDRCISCHVAVDLPHFSPDADSIWGDLEKRVAELRQPTLIAELCEQGKRKEASKRLEQATRLERLQNFEKVLSMHPLMEGESRPFQFHPLDKYGCTTCHGGNGHALVAERAHGPVFDGEYEAALSGPRPQFTEVDNENDPIFSKMFNHKPGHELIFQTKPILAGPLVEAKCIQCHLPGSEEKENTTDSLISNYRRGKELYIAQGCYACHRIAGFSRGNVGPELTRAGLNYPWYIKESIVWPQADLPSSTMPNFKLDHDELGCLMTFLMGQTGETKAISEVEHHMNLSEWERGGKMPWETPAAPVHVHDVREGQRVFATQGCASCHRLKGFDAEVAVHDKEWFTRLIPPSISGSVLAKIVEEKGVEIDHHIENLGQEEGVLGEIEKKFPGLLMSFYTHFKFASRAYHTAYRNDPERLQEYQERLNRVLWAYIQEYGLGREIAPQLSWSGVWRDDQWLLGHFHNPSAYTAKSLMPMIPFDDSKFLMLNNMLHVLGSKNRDNIQKIWYSEGFDPSQAFETLCSACHGKQRQGNGSVAEWIFPIPKNLRDPVFLSELTKERAIDSITHGIKGTPMPPWGEAIEGEQPVLSPSQIGQLVEWLYQDVHLEGSSKWSYTPQQVIEEMKKENVFLSPVKDDALVDAYFEKRVDAGKDKERYYIREEFYTPENLENGKDLFMLNCAVCHGNEGAGTGVRAQAMVEAKPRVLTDLHWIRSEDDLFILRSIKYGVPGTAMIAWGDQTTAAQRMELALFIRNLSRSALWREELHELLYSVFDLTIRQVEEERLAVYSKLEELEKLYQTRHNTLESLINTTATEQVGSLYIDLHHLSLEQKNVQEHAQLYQKMIDLIKEEKQIYQNLGEQIIAADLAASLFTDYFELIRTREQTPFTNLMATLESTIDHYQQQISIEQQKLRSSKREEAIAALTNAQRPYLNLKTKLTTQLAAAAKLHVEQAEIAATLKEQAG